MLNEKNLSHYILLIKIKNISNFIIIYYKEKKILKIIIGNLHNLNNIKIIREF
jgi:hypothetical protein